MINDLNIIVTEAMMLNLVEDQNSLFMNPNKTLEGIEYLINIKQSKIP